MPRIAGVDIPPDKHIEISLTYIYGLGRHRAKEILNQTKIDPYLKAKNLDGQQIQDLTKVISTLSVEGELRKATRDSIERLKRISAYRGLRHLMKLPSRGQRTRTNARTLKGNRKTVGAMTKETRQKIETAK